MVLEPGLGTAKATAVFKKLKSRQQFSTASHRGEQLIDTIITVACQEELKIEAAA